LFCLTYSFIDHAISNVTNPIVTAVIITATTIQKINRNYITIKQNFIIIAIITAVPTLITGAPIISNLIITGKPICSSQQRQTLYQNSTHYKAPTRINHIITIVIIAISS